MPMTTVATAFETQPCSRCGGSGWYSRCQTWGHTCFKCGIRPHQQGLGRYLSRRGQAAYDYYLSLLPTRRAVDLLPGDVLLEYGRRHTVREVRRPSHSAIIRDGVRISEGYVDVLSDAVTLCLVPEGHVYSLVPSAEEQARFQDQALAYQATLTARGTIRKRSRAAA